MTQLKTLAEIINAVGEGYITCDIEHGGDEELSSSRADSWSAVLLLKNGKQLRVHWSGYSPGYSEYTPSMPGEICFHLLDPETGTEYNVH